MNPSSEKLLLTFFATCAISFVVFAGGIALFFWKLFEAIKDSPLFPPGSGNPATAGEMIILLLVLVMILSPLFIFPVSAYLNRAKITSLKAPNSVFGMWGAFPIILLVLLILPFTIYSSYQSYFYDSFKQQLQSQPIDVSVPNLEVVVNEKSERILNITVQIENMPDDLSEFYLWAIFGTENPEYDGAHMGTIIAKKDGDGWTFSDPKQPLQMTLPSPNIVTVSIPVNRYKHMTPPSRQSLKIQLGTTYMNRYILIKTIWLPIQIPD